MCAPLHFALLNTSYRAADAVLASMIGTSISSHLAYLPENSATEQQTCGSCRSYSRGAGLVAWCL